MESCSEHCRKSDSKIICQNTDHSQGQTSGSNGAHCAAPATTAGNNQSEELSCGPSLQDNPQHTAQQLTSSGVSIETSNGATMVCVQQPTVNGLPPIEPTQAIRRTTHTPQPFFLTFSRLKAYRYNRKHHAHNRSQQDLASHRSTASQNALDMDTASMSSPASGWGEGGMHMAASPPSSITGTPTMVRARPRLPLGLIKPGNARNVGKEEVENLSDALSSLGTTDFVRKYSRRCRAGNSGTSTPSGGSSSVTTPSLMRSPLFSPPPESGQGHHTRTGSLTLTRMRSIKLKLQKVKETQELEEKQTTKDKKTRKVSQEEQKGEDTRAMASDKGPEPAKKSERKLDTKESSVPNFASVQSSASLTASTGGTTVMTSHLQATTKVVFSSLQDLSKVSESDSDSTWLPVINTPQQFKEASKEIEARMPPPLRQAPESKTESPEKGVAIRRKLFSLKSSVSTDSDASSSSIPGRPFLTRESSEDTCLAVEELDEDSAPVVPVPLSIDDDEGLGAMDEATEEDGGIRIQVPQIITPGSERRRRSKKGRKKDETNRRQRANQESEKSPNSRFLTHPPIRDRSPCSEAGSMDSNGLGALREGQEVKQLSPQPSVASIDSNLSSDVTSSSYVDVVQDIVSDSNAKHERKNSKQLKQKSKSDPCGNSKVDDIDIPSVIAAHHSEPVLEKNKKAKASLSSSEDSKPERKVSKSENLLSKADDKAQKVTDSKSVEVRVTETSGESSDEGAATKATTTRQKSKRPKKKSHTVANIIQRWENKDDQEGRNSDGSRSTRVKIATAISRASPDIDKKSKLSALASLTLPLSGKKTSLTRSHSSASVVQKPKNLPPTPATADAKKRPRLPEQLTKSSFEADASANKTAKNSVFSPSLEPIFSQSTLSLFEGTDKEKVGACYVILSLHGLQAL